MQTKNIKTKNPKPKDLITIEHRDIILIEI